MLYACTEVHKFEPKVNATFNLRSNRSREDNHLSCMQCMGNVASNTSVTKLWYSCSGFKLFQLVCMVSEAWVAMNFNKLSSFD